MLCKSHPHRYCSVFDEKKKEKKFRAVPEKRKGKKKKICIPLWGDFL
jgi:hypothetical protein